MSAQSPPIPEKEAFSGSWSEVSAKRLSATPRLPRSFSDSRLRKHLPGGAPELRSTRWVRFSGGEQVRPQATQSSECSFDASGPNWNNTTPPKARVIRSSLCLRRLCSRDSHAALRSRLAGHPGIHRGAALYRSFWQRG
jgi:hypothetical protein